MQLCAQSRLGLPRKSDLEGVREGKFSFRSSTRFVMKSVSLGYVIARKNTHAAFRKTLLK
jgi:hypothetical protein